MFEKIAGVALISKQRAILLMEADFNCHNKLIFGSRMMALGREHGLVPDEIFSAKGKTAEDAILLQTLVYDYARQRRLTVVTLSMPLNAITAWLTLCWLSLSEPVKYHRVRLIACCSPSEKCNFILEKLQLLL